MNLKQKKEGIFIHIVMVEILLLCFFPLPTNAQSVTAKTNFINWGTLSPNLAFETAIGKRTSLEIPVSYNPWTFSENKKWKHVLVQPEFRWWNCEPFNGQFFGLHAHYARYNIGNVNIGNLTFPAGVHLKELNDYRYDGWLIGAGITYGYQFYLSPRFNLEFAIGAGYAYLDYKKYECLKCGKLIEEKEKHYIGPTKAAVSLVYFIK